MTLKKPTHFLAYVTASKKKKKKKGKKVSLWAASPAAGLLVHSVLRRTNRGTS